MGRLWLTPKELSERLEVHHSTVREWVSKGDLQAYRVGSQIRIPREAARAVLARAGLSLDDENESPGTAAA